MPNIEIAINDIGSIAISEIRAQDDQLTFDSAGTVLAGTILARDSTTGFLVPYEKGGTTDGNGVPKVVTSVEVVAVGSGEEPVRVLISGVLNKQRLVIDADGDDSNIDLVVRDALRNYSLIPVDVTELNTFDNI